MGVATKYMTYQEFRELDFDDNDQAHYELINGILVRKQSPTYDHQLILREIGFHLTSYMKKTRSGQVLYAPMDVVLDDNNAYHPDISYIKKERYFLFDEKERIIMGAPDLAVEILSKSTAVYDKGDKRDNYEKYGVREYWLVDPVKKSFEVYALMNERFKLVAYLEETGVLKSEVLEGFEMDIEQVFEEAKVK